MLIRAGVLSDTHLIRPDALFRRQIKQCFHACDVIIHAGDLTDLSVLEVFHGKTIYAVHGNMCDGRVRSCQSATAVVHTQPVHDRPHPWRTVRAGIETALWNLFPEADCMIYGHTHRPTCHHYDKTLFLNPGSFQATSRYGAPGTYAILEADDELRVNLFEIPSAS